MLHRIRLGPPWKTTPTADRTLHRRSFGRPRNLDPGERVWLALSTATPAQVVLNGEPLGSTGGEQPFWADVTDRLAVRNEIVIDCRPGDGPRDVALLIGSEQPTTSTDPKPAA
jgi:hypothetical protein